MKLNFGCLHLFVKKLFRLKMHSLFEKSFLNQLSNKQKNSVSGDIS
jgi:hypothetical protein